MIESSRESGRKLLSGITDYARHFGPWRIHWEPQGLRSVDKIIQSQKFNGILVRDIAHVETLAATGIPTVSFTYGKESKSSSVVVDTDDRGLAEMVAQDFLSRGFKNYAFFGPSTMVWALRRSECFSETVKASGYTANVLLADMTSGGVIKLNTICEWLSDLPKPVAIMAANDDVGQLLVQLCQETGLKVPDDCAIVGVDNDSVVCGVCDPPLSSISIEQHVAGYEAARVLDVMMRGEHQHVSLITAEVGTLVVRESSDIFAIDDFAVSKALRFIQENAQRPLLVDEIVEASGVFRRGLERRFRRALNQTIQQRYREVRAQYLAKLIGESHLSLEAISEKCGFAEPSHMSRFFMSVKGQAPSAYRKKVYSR